MCFTKEIKYLFFFETLLFDFYYNQLLLVSNTDIELPVISPILENE